MFDIKKLYDYSLEEYKIVCARIINTEEALNKWQNAFLLANGLIVTILSQLLTSNVKGCKLYLAMISLCILASIVTYKWIVLSGSTIKYLSAMHFDSVKVKEQTLNYYLHADINQHESSPIRIKSWR